jgi:hypothetical protein
LRSAYPSFGGIEPPNWPQAATTRQPLPQIRATRSGDFHIIGVGRSWLLPSFSAE